jgi:hypothetical protein
MDKSFGDFIPLKIVGGRNCVEAISAAVFILKPSYPIFG